MISLWHLLWIVPTASLIGMTVTALCVAAKIGDRDDG